MKQFALAGLVLIVATMACSPFAAPISAADAQTTALAQAGTAAALTQAALPTDKPTRPPQPTATLLVAPSATATASETSTSAPDGSASAAPTITATLALSGTPASPTLTVTPTATATATFSGTTTATFTVTPGVLLYGTVPPDVPFGYVTLKNLSNDMVYISFKCVIENGLISYLEYPVYSVVKTKIPTGPCHWTAWVKGKEFSGDIHVKKFDEYTFTFKPKKVTVTQP